MLKKMFLIITIALSGILCLTACEKRSEQNQSEQVIVKTEAEYEQEAKEQITEENMQEELEKIEKELNTEVSQEK
jgi:hypothetical protein